MIDAEHIALFFSTAAGFWIAGFCWGNTVAWIRALRSVA